SSCSSSKPTGSSPSGTASRSTSPLITTASTTGLMRPGVRGHSAAPRRNTKMRASRTVMLLALAAQLLLPGAPRAADYPARPIKPLVVAAAGGPPAPRPPTTAEPLSALFGQPVLVENRPGAGGNLAAEAVARAAPDGYTLLVSFTSHTINATLYPKLPFD